MQEMNVGASLDISAYLQRIGYSGSTELTLDTLRGLHQAHLLSVPFENLDIHVPREIVLDVERIYAKIVIERKGGFCYEQNGLFAAILRELGFAVTLLSARVPGHDGNPGPEFDHLVLRVDLDEPWLADVGFGDSFLEPVRLRVEPQEQDGRRWRVKDRGEQLVLLHDADNGDWVTQYEFSLQPRDLAEFAQMCHYHQTSPDSHFTRSRICSLATPDGRITLTSDRLIVTRNGERDEHPIDGEAAWQRVLLERFGIRLQQPVSTG